MALSWARGVCYGVHVDIELLEGVEELLPPLAPPLDPSEGMLWLLGLGVAFLSTILSTIGLLIQKTSADLEKHKPAWRRWRFWLGFGINLGDLEGRLLVTGVQAGFDAAARVREGDEILSVAGVRIGGRGQAALGEASVRVRLKGDDVLSAARPGSRSDTPLHISAHH